jgi:hypothetical protein
MDLIYSRLQTIFSCRHPPHRPIVCDLKHCHKLNILKVINTLQETAKSMRAQITYDNPIVSYLIYDGSD